MLPIDPENTYKLAMERALEFCKAENYDVAEVIVRQLLRCVSDNQEALHLLGSIRHRLGDYEESLKIFEQLENIDDNNPDYHNDLALALSCKGDLNGAIGHLSRALDLTDMENKTKRSQYLSNMSVQLRRAGLFGQAQTAIRNAMDYTDYKDVDVWRNFAALHNEILDIETSIDAYEWMISLKDDPEFHVDLSYALFLKEDLPRAWEEYEYRYKVFPQFGYLFRHYDHNKLWKDEDLSGKTLVVYCEQGLGDTIQFVRYIPWLKKRYPGIKVVLHCNETVVSLFKNSDLGIDDYLTESVANPVVKIPEHDYHISLMSLPHRSKIYRMPIEQDDYLNVADDDKCHSSYLTPTKKIDLGAKSKFRVGICWAGSPKHPNDARRSVFLKHFEEIASLPYVELFSFQKDKRPHGYRYGQPVDFCEGANFQYTDLSDQLTDLDSTAALLKEMDLIISVDTSVLHLAGAMGLDVVALLPRVPDWRWGRSGSTEWYISMMLLRQPTLGDWESVFKSAATLIKDTLDIE